MLAETNRSIVRHHLDLLRVNKRPAALDTYVDDEALKQRIADLEHAFHGFYIDPLDIVAEGERVFVRGMLHGVHRGEYLGVAPTDALVAAPVHVEYRLAHGKIVQHWMLIDAQSILAQVGAVHFVLP